MIPADDRLAQIAWNKAKREGRVETRLCSWCKKEYLPTRWWQRFCNVRCRQALQRIEIEESHLRKAAE
jgi:hypothetical protein